MKFCPQCNKVAEFDRHFDRHFCTGTNCNWRSEKISEREPEATIKVGTGQMKGVLVAKHNGNKDYPGICISLDREVIAEVEIDKYSGEIQIVNYKKNQDEPEVVVKWNDEEE